MGSDEACRVDRVYAVMRRINQLIVRACSREVLFLEACRIAVEYVGVRTAWIGMLDPVTREISTRASHGDPGVDAIDFGRLTTYANTLYGPRARHQAVRHQTPAVVDDIEHQLARGDDRDAMLAAGSRSLANLPVVVADEMVGVMSFLSAETYFFDEDKLRLLRELALGIGFALDHLVRAEKLDDLAYYDALTGLANNSLFHERLARQVAGAAAEHRHVSLALIDVERFKRVNDTLGRDAGDMLLRQIAARLATSCGNVEFARIGADHFAMILPDVHDEAAVADIFLERVQHCFGRPFDILGHELWVTAKTGVAMCPDDGADTETLYRHAEVAVRKAKASTESLLFYDRRMTDGLAGKLALENKLRRALENDEFLLHYQPKIDLETRRMVGLEALIRWSSPELGLVAPSEFIPLMEETGLILDVGLWAMRQAALDRKRWVDMGLAAPRVAVNVSAVQLRKPDFVATVEAALRHGAEAHGIDLEITESLVMEDIDSTLEKLHALCGLGIELAIDDFGTGYSSLTYLAKLPARILKIDRAFILTMNNDPNSMTLVSTMISLAHSLRMKVVAEGVETQEQACLLQELRCDQVQGFLFSAPLPFDQVSSLIERVG